MKGKENNLKKNGDVNPRDIPNPDKLTTDFKLVNTSNTSGTAMVLTFKHMFKPFPGLVLIDRHIELKKC